MRRRKFAGTNVILLMRSIYAGCLSRETNSSSAVPYSDLSPEAQKEVRKAIEYGGYEDCDMKLYDEVGSSRIKYNGTIYTPSYQHGDGKKDECNGTEMFLQLRHV